VKDSNVSTQSSLPKKVYGRGGRARQEVSNNPRHPQIVECLEPPVEKEQKELIEEKESQPLNDTQQSFDLANFQA